MEITPKLREQIYLEEKENREEEGCSGSLLTLLLMSLSAALVLFGIYWISKKPSKNRLKIENIRRAYDGLSPDEVQ